MWTWFWVWNGGCITFCFVGSSSIIHNPLGVLIGYVVAWTGWGEVTVCVDDVYWEEEGYCCSCCDDGGGYTSSSFSPPTVIIARRRRWWWRRWWWWRWWKHNYRLLLLRPLWMLSSIVDNRQHAIDVQLSSSALCSLSAISLDCKKFCKWKRLSEVKVRGPYNKCRFLEEENALGLSIQILRWVDSLRDIL